MPPLGMGGRRRSYDYVHIKGVHINGVDMIRWNKAGKIIEFKVMIRPLQAINMIHQEMAARLQRNA